MDYFTYQSILKPGKGSLLISEPFLPDPNFERTVVLLCENNEEGSFGFVLNKMSVLTFEDVIEEVQGFQQPLYVGGPVQQDTLHFLHRMGDELEGSMHIVNDLYWGGNFEQLMTMINTGTISSGDFKFFIGYSGWSAGQLEEELKGNSWIVSESANGGQIFDQHPENMWKDVLQSMGGRYKVIANYPIDPRLN